MKINSEKENWIPWMHRVLALAALADGETSPNPLVGAVVLDINQNIVGEGFHSQAGESHAEIGALSQADSAAKGGTLLVNLEPCCHHGRTPPCTEAILKAGVQTVVIAIQDPDPRVSGKGIAVLREAGIEVITDILKDEATYLNRAFIFRMQTGRPWGILKWAMSFDGRTGLPNGESKWISCEKSRKQVHQLRAKCDAVIVGGRTVRVDDPLLTSRGLAKREPSRVVFSSSLDLPRDAQIWNTEFAETLICYGPKSKIDLLHNLPDGPEKIRLEESSPVCLLETIAKRGCNKVLWECGSNLASKALQQNCVQEIVLFLSPKLIGGLSAMTPLSDLGFVSMNEVIQVQGVSSSKNGDDIVLNMII